MFKTAFTAYLSLALAASVTLMAQDPPRSGTYRVQSGTYEETGGFVGFLSYSLPNSAQTFVSLTVAASNRTAELKFLDNNRQHIFFVRLTNGIVSGDRIRFQYMTSHPYGSDLPPAWVDYTITNAAGHLWISGSITSGPVCCDIPYRFEHSQVKAEFIPALSIRALNGIEVCWTSATNQNCQVQFSTDPNRQAWTDLGGPIRCNGATNCLTDIVVPGRSQGFYRVVTLP